MKKNLLLSAFFLSHFFSSPLELLASSEEGLASPEKNALYWQQCLQKTDLSQEELLQAAQHLGQDPNQTYAAAGAYHQYLVQAPVQLEALDLTPDTRALYTGALKVFGALGPNEKLTYRDSYASLMRWHLNNPQTTPFILLTLADEFYCLELDDDVAKASQRYVAHPNKGTTDKTYPFKAARAHAAAGQMQKASILYSLALGQTSQDFTLSNVRKAALHYATIESYEKCLATYKLLFARFPADQLWAVDFLNAATVAVGRRDDASALDFLTNYFDREESKPNPQAYRHRATCAMNLGDYETAKEYWHLAIKGGAKMDFADYANAADTFDALDEPSLAATYWKKALDLGGPNQCYPGYKCACSVFLKVKDYENAMMAANGMLAHRGVDEILKDNPSDLFMAAMAYSHNGLTDKSLPLWERYIAKNLDDEDAHLWAGIDLYKAGDYLNASHAFERVSHQKMKANAARPNFIKCVAYSHFMAGRQEKAKDILRRFEEKNTTLKELCVLHQKKEQAKEKQEEARSSKNISALKIAICADSLEQIEYTLSHLKRSPHEKLEDIEQQMLTRKEQAKALLAALHNGSSHAVSQTSTKYPTSESDQLATAFDKIQKLAQEVESLNQLYKKEKSVIDRLAAKEQRKRIIAQAVQEASVEFFPAQTSFGTKIEPAKPAKKKTRGKASDTRKVKGKSNKSSTTASSAVNLSKVEWRLTPTAQKHLSDLQKVPGFHGKFETFRKEIEMEPWGRRGNALTHASGRAKLLKGYDNVFSRRFSKGDRFFYRVERQEDGCAVVTILGLMGHDLS